MNYPRIFFILGLIIAIIPFLGIPLVWKHILTVIVGAVIIAFAILLRSALRGRKSVNAVAPVKQSAPRKPRKPSVSGMQSRAPLSSVMTNDTQDANDYSQVEALENVHDQE